MTRAIQKKANVSDVELLTAIAGRNRAALSTFYDRYAQRLYGLALKILQDESIAQDVIQDLFLFLWENAHRFTQRRGSPVAWMMILCRNRCIDKLRQKERTQKRSATLDKSRFALIDPNESESPFERVHHKELEATVSKALQSLPGEQRATIEMAYFKGCSQSEIAEELGLPLGTVKTRIRLGMQKLRDLMKDSGW